MAAIRVRHGTQEEIRARYGTQKSLTYCSSENRSNGSVAKTKSSQKTLLVLAFGCHCLCPWYFGVGVVVGQVKSSYYSPQK